MIFITTADWIHLIPVRAVAGSRKQGNEPLASVKGAESLDQLGQHYILEKDSAPQN